MKALILADCESGVVARSTLSLIRAASFASTIDVFSYAAKSVDATCLNGAQINNLYTANDACFETISSEAMCEFLYDFAKDYDVVIASSSSFSKDLLPRLSAKLERRQLSEVVDVISKSEFVRPIYAGNAMAHMVVNEGDKFLMTVRSVSFAPCDLSQTSSVNVVNMDQQVSSKKAAMLEWNERKKITSIEKKSVGFVDLQAADIVISGGRALGSEQNFEMLRSLAKTMGAAVGASRAAVDAGYISNDCQVGQTGKVVAPSLYVAVGISGAIQHVSGMKDSKVIVAINKDPEAPIFKICDYGLVGDLFDEVPKFHKLIEAHLRQREAS